MLLEPWAAVVDIVNNAPIWVALTLVVAIVMPLPLIVTAAPSRKFVPLSVTVRVSP